MSSSAQVLSLGFISFKMEFLSSDCNIVSILSVILYSSSEKIIVQKFWDNWAKSTVDFSVLFLTTVPCEPTIWNTKFNKKK